MDLLISATHYSAEKHVDQRRKSGVKAPYINHPIAVANLICSIGKVNTAEILSAALLHDVVEDTKTPIEEIKLNFGEKVGGIVAEVTDDRSLSKAERKKAQISHAKTMSREAKIVKLADKLHNLNDFINSSIPHGWSLEDVQDYFLWSSCVVNGLRGTNEGLENALTDLFNNGKIVIDGKSHKVFLFTFPDIWQDDGENEAKIKLEEYYKKC